MNFLYSFFYDNKIVFLNSLIIYVIHHDVLIKSANSSMRKNSFANVLTCSLNCKDNPEERLVAFSSDHPLDILWLYYLGQFVLTI